MSIHTGEFNVKLRKTGFLSQPKMEARLIARHPHRFLEHYADRKIGVLNSENESLSHFIDEVKEAGNYEKKEKVLVQKQSEHKQRTFLLNMASSPAMGADLVKEFRYDLLSGAGDGASNDNNNSNGRIDYEAIIDNYLTEIKMADKQDIELWIASNHGIRDLKLPYGLPSNLRIPLDPSAMEADGSLSSFVETANDEFLLLDGEYHTKMEDLCKKILQNYIQLTENLRWTIAESALLFYVITALEESPTPTSAALQHEMTTRLFPHKTRDEIIRQKYLLKAKRTLEEKRANIVRDWIRDKEELQSKTNHAWEALHKERVKKLEFSLRLKKQKEVCAEWSALLKRLRQAKSENIRKIQVMAEPFIKKRESLEKSKSVKEEERRSGVKSAAQKFRERKQEALESDKRRKEQVQQIVEQIQKAQIEMHKTRVNFRQIACEQKAVTRKMAEQEAEAEKERRRIILERSKEKIQIDYDPSNVLSETHATLVRRYETTRRRDPDEEDMVKFFREQYSFTAEALWADRRVKLEAKLREAGLMSSSYARQVLQAMQPREKPHLSTQIKFDQNEG